VTNWQKKALVCTLALIVALIALATETTVAQTSGLPILPDDVYGTAPPRTVENWIRISLLGPRLHPYPILWLSPQKFRRTYFEALITFSPQDYSRVSSLSHAYACIERTKYAGDMALLVTGHSRHRQADCILSVAQGCDLWSNLENLPSMHQSSESTKLMQAFSREMACNGNETPPE
jgi:hypothetical protein